MRYDLYIHLRAFENRGKGEVETVGLRRPVADRCYQNETSSRLLSDFRGSNASHPLKNKVRDHLDQGEGRTAIT